jgi:hypothetical protein
MVVMFGFYLPCSLLKLLKLSEEHSVSFFRMSGLFQVDTEGTGWNSHRPLAFDESLFRSRDRLNSFKSFFITDSFLFIQLLQDPPEPFEPP